MLLVLAVEVSLAVFSAAQSALCIQFYASNAASKLSSVDILCTHMGEDKQKKYSFLSEQLSTQKL